MMLWAEYNKSHTVDKSTAVSVSSSAQSQRHDLYSFFRKGISPNRAYPRRVLQKLTKKVFGLRAGDGDDEKDSVIMTLCSVIRIEGENSEKHQKGGLRGTPGPPLLQQRPDGVIVLTYLVTMPSVVQTYDAECHTVSTNQLTCTKAHSRHHAHNGATFRPFSDSSSP